MRRALLQADVVLLLGARLNWILHFGLPPRFDPNVKIIQVCERTKPSLAFLLEELSTSQCCDINTSVLCVQVDLCAEEMGNNVRPSVALLGDVNAIVTQVTAPET